MWEQARCTFYNRRERARKLAKPGKLGPKPFASNVELLDLIRGGQAASPFLGAGHRKGMGAAALWEGGSPLAFPSNHNLTLIII